MLVTTYLEHLSIAMMPFSHINLILFCACQLDNEYGSPSLEDMEAFQHALGLKLEAALGSEAAGELEVEVSSPVSPALLKCWWHGTPVHFLPALHPCLA